MFQNENSTARFTTASQLWFQNSFWNYDWTIFLLRNWQNVKYKQTSKQTNKQKLKISISTTRFGTTSQQQTSFVLNILWWTPSSFAKLELFRYIKWEKTLYKMRKSKKTTFQWPLVSRLLTTSQIWFQNRSQIFVSGMGRAFSELRKNSESGFFSLSKLWFYFRPLESGFLAFSHFT